MQPLPIASAVLALLLSNVLTCAADPPSQQAEMERLKQRVKVLESELKAIRQEFSALHAVLRASADKLSRSPATPKPATQKTLEISVLDGGWGGASGADIRAVCLSAAQEIRQHIPDRNLEPISIRHSGKGPMVIYGKGSAGERRVLLNVSGNYWAQFAFQFAHEFCHILCNYREAENPNLWFEESLCETASLFAMRRMAKTWKTKPPYANWKSFSSALSDYANDRLKNTVPEGMDLAAWYRQHEEALRSNGTDRAKNQIVAAALLKLLEKSPQDWPAVSYLNQWDRSQPLSFQAYLLDWQRRVPDKHKPFVAKVGSLFEIELAR